MKKIYCFLFLGLFITTLSYSQSGNINNTIGSGGSFKVKSASSDSLFVVKENGAVGIGTNNPGSALDVAGKLTIDQIKVDGIPSFFVTHIEEAGLDNQPYVLASWDETTSSGSHDNSASFNPSTGEFTVPREGFYFLSAHIEIFLAGTSGISIYITNDSNLTGLTATSATPASFGYLTVSGIVKLSAGSVVTITIGKPGSTGSCTAGSGYFSGYLVSDF